MELTPTEIRRQQFDLVRRGFDPQEVGVFLERVADQYAEREQQLAAARAETRRLERALEEARSAEEAVRLTMVAAAKAKDEMISEAREEAAAAVATARTEAETILSAARREALGLMEEARADAEELVRSAKSEREALEGQLEAMRQVVKGAAAVLKGMASGAMEDLGRVADMLAAAPEGADFDFVPEPLPAAMARDEGGDPIDRLLAQLRAVES